MKYSIIFTTIIALAVSSQLVFAGEIIDTYTAGDTLTATKMDNIKTAVNDNDGNISANTTAIGVNATNIGTKQDRVTGTCTVGQSIGEINADGSVTCRNEMPGADQVTDFVASKLDTTARTQLILTITAPAAGFVLLNYTGVCYLSHTSGATQVVIVQITNSSTDTPKDAPGGSYCLLSSTVPSGNYRFGISAQYILPAIKGTNTYYVRAINDITATGPGYLDSQTLTGLYFPQMY